MKKMLFCLQTMVLGGVEKELISVLKKIHSDYDITLLLLYQEDTEIIKEIPEDVKIKIIGIDKNYYFGSAIHLIKERIKKGKFFEAATIAVKRFLRLGMTGSNIQINDIPTLDITYDIAICYHIHSPTMLKYLAQNITATKKIAWIHNDFYTSGYQIQRLKKYVNKYDEFIAVSQKVENEFRVLCPWYRGGISTAHNYLDVSEIKLLSKDLIDDQEFLEQKNVKILTIGRFSKQKGIDIAISVCAMLKKRNLKFHWYLIGYGKLEDFYRSLIEKNDVGDCFTIIGKKANPYPYILNSDIYVQPSRHEAYPLVLMEAKALQKPIVCTDFNGADEQIKSGVNGIIVPLNDVEALANEISRLICSKETRNKFSNELKKWTSDDDLKEIVKHFE